MSSKMKKACASCGEAGAYRVSIVSRENREVAGTEVWACATHVSPVRAGVELSLRGSAYRVLVRLPYVAQGGEPVKRSASARKAARAS